MQKYFVIVSDVTLSCDKRTSSVLTARSFGKVLAIALNVFASNVIYYTGNSCTPPHNTRRRHLL